MLLDKKKALITGANSFLGKEIVKKLSQKFFVLKTGTKEIQDPDYFKANLKNDEEAKKLVEWATHKHSIECLICCVGGNKGIQSKDDAYRIDNKDILEIFNLNVLTAINCCRHIIPHMLNHNSGKIIFIGSNLVGNPHPYGFLTSYVVAKAALHEYTINLANQLKDTNIRVNCVSPCGISGSSPTPKKSDVSATDVAYWVDCLCNPASVLNGQIIRVVKEQQILSE
jgi:NAD(P)-dependent dehydrogenase (short-subunit alcohol dehydrogenase family)